MITRKFRKNLTLPQIDFTSGCYSLDRIAAGFYLAERIPGMKTVILKKQIFLSNALMILITLAAVVLVNLAAVKIQWEFIERDWESSMETAADGTDVEQLLKDWTVHQRSFYVLAVADIVLCVSMMLGISLFFTRKLEKQLLLEQEKNAAYERARTEMIAGISHDLRTPLTAIRGTVKALLDGVVADKAQQEKFLLTAYRRTEDMNVLLDQLFYLSKLETGAMPLHLQTVDLGKYLRDYVERKQEMLRQDLSGEGQGTQILYRAQCEETAKVRIDPEALQRILDNLVENSRKYAEVPELKMEIILKDKEGIPEICFRDNGVGVPEEKLLQIFEEFYRVDESRNRKSGSGLGLYVVKSLAEAMGGRVSAANEDGLAVRIELPGGKK